jgi:hypothetical protein
MRADRERERPEIITEGPLEPGHTVGVEILADHGLDLSAAAGTTQFADLDWDDWDLEDELRRVQRMLSPSPNRADAARKPYAALDGDDGPIASLADWRLPTVTPIVVAAEPSSRAGAPIAKPRGKALGAMAWFILSLGLMAFVCGAVLLGWSYVSGQHELWHLGLPIALGGQAAMLLGFVLQLDRLRLDNSQAAEKLDTVDERILDLKQATVRLGTTNRGSVSQTFYAHLAEGASPHILLADLKGQLDLLAVRMSQS